MRQTRTHIQVGCIGSHETAGQKRYGDLCSKSAVPLTISNLKAIEEVELAIAIQVDEQRSIRRRRIGDATRKAERLHFARGVAPFAVTDKGRHQQKGVYLLAIDKQVRYTIPIQVSRKLSLNGLADGGIWRSKSLRKRRTGKGVRPSATGVLSNDVVPSRNVIVPVGLVMVFPVPEAASGWTVAVSSTAEPTVIVVGLAVTVVVAAFCPAAWPDKAFSINSKAEKRSRRRTKPHLHPAGRDLPGVLLEFAGGRGPSEYIGRFPLLCSKVNHGRYGGFQSRIRFVPARSQGKQFAHPSAGPKLM